MGNTGLAYEKASWDGCHAAPPIQGTGAVTVVRQLFIHLSFLFLLFFFFFFYQGLQKCKWVCCEKHGSNTLLHILYAPGGLKSVFAEGQIRAQIATAYKKIVFLEKFRFCTTTTKHGYTCGGYYHAKINNGGSRSNICSFLFKT